MPQRPEKENMPDFQRWHSRGSGIRDSQICTHGLIKAFLAKINLCHEKISIYTFVIKGFVSDIGHTIA